MTTLKECLESGKRFKRKKSLYWHYPNVPYASFLPSDILAEDWEISEIPTKQEIEAEIDNLVKRRMDLEGPYVAAHEEIKELDDMLFKLSSFRYPSIK